MKLYQEPIKVIKQDGVPHRVIWRLQPYDVQQIEERWLYHGQWWTTPKLSGHCRRYFRIVVAAPMGSSLTMEVYEERNNWMLSRLQD
jgi:hypothetical protein